VISSIGLANIRQMVGKGKKKEYNMQENVKKVSKLAEKR
jgi:hypothetical protein